MKDSQRDSSPQLDSPASNSTRRPLWPAYATECFTSISSTLLMVGIFFYTEHYFHWGLGRNFLLAAGQGAAYVIGSLSAQHVAGRFGRRRGLIRVCLVLTALPLLALAAPTPAWTIAALIVYTMFAAMVWPALESLVSSGADAHTMSRRVGRYNLVWSATNAVTFAASGAVIQNWPAGLFIIPALSHLAACATLWMNPAVDPAGAAAAEPVHVEPEPELIAKRTLALWLARIALPATYVVVYSLSAMMPSLPVMQSLDTATRTAVGSAWMIARVFAFLALGATAWWHTRPRILLVAAAGMLVAFLGVTIRPSQLAMFADVGRAVDLASMVGWQVALGGVMGVIYAGSLYFGMVLSEGSTEHGGYHEALIGVGSVLGPGTAAITQWRWPGDLRAGVIAVSCVIFLTLLAAGAATVAASRRPTP